MRIVAALVLMLGLVGCGADDTDKAEEPPLAAYRVLVRDYNGLVEAYIQRTDEREPTNPRQVGRYVGYDFHEGVRLLAFEKGMTGLCLTGPVGTYLTLSTKDEFATRTVGTGKCDYGDGDVVLREADIGGGESTEKREKVEKGQDVVDAIPAFSAYGDITPQG